MPKELHTATCTSENLYAKMAYVLAFTCMCAYDRFPKCATFAVSEGGVISYRLLTVYSLQNNKVK